MKMEKFITRSSINKNQGVSEGTLMLFYSNFYVVPFFFFLYFLNFEYHVKDAQKLNKGELNRLINYCAQMLILLMQLTAFKVFETCRKLSSIRCDYLDVSLHAIYKDQIFDEEIDHKFCVKNLSGFLTNIIAKIIKEFCYIDS